MKRTLALLAAFGLAGYLILFLIFPRFNPAAKWNHQVDRTMAIAKARETAAQFGMDVAGWDTRVTAMYDKEAESYLAVQPQPLLGNRLTPTRMRVHFENLRTGKRFEVRMNARGELLGITQPEPEARRPRPGAIPRQPSAQEDANPIETDVAADQREAEETLNKVLGQQRQAFPSTPTVGIERNDRVFSWAVADERVKLVADARVRNGKVRELILNVNQTPKFRREQESARGGALAVFSNIENFIFWPAIIGVVILYFIGLARKLIPHRRTLTLLLLSFVFLLAVNTAGSFFDAFRGGFTISNSRPNYWLSLLLPWAVFALVNLAFAAVVYFFYATGISLSGQFAGRRTLDVELILKGKFLTRPVMESLLGGMLAGGLLAVAPHVAAACKLFQNVIVNPAGLEDTFAARSALAASLFSGRIVIVLLLFAFLAQAVEAWIKNKTAARALTFCLAFLGFGGVDLFRASFPAAFVTAIATTAVLTWIYYRFGLFSAIVSVMASHVACGAAALLSQPLVSLHVSGWKSLAALTVALAAASIGVLKAREAREDEIAPEIRSIDTPEERERLKAEFDVARRAQQHMLPDAPPNVPGLRISAICTPSKEVGGDLYDFIPLRDGRLGIVVADVSGKGVPASLYMTLTKGLLGSVSEQKSDPGEILREVNRHLYDVCRRKMFVTLFLGVIDPAAKTLAYARAGHNPTIFRSPTAQTTSLLKSRGMGLGLNRGNLFDQSLKVEARQLQPGDKLFFYSDGITEAMNVQNEEYGEERLMKVAAKADGLNAEAARDAVLADVRQFLGNNPPQDDQTLVVVEITGG